MDPRFDPLTLDGVSCPICGDDYEFPPTSLGRSEMSECPNGHGEGPQIDDYDLWCPTCRHFVSLSVEAL